MKLKTLKTFICDAYRTNWVFVKIETDDGLYGWGEATLEYRELTVVEALKELERGLKGRDLHNIEAWWQDAYRDAYWRGGAVLMSALSAIEMALWDIKGKALGVPVFQLLGGKVRESVPCYANGWFANATEPEEFAARAVEAVALGYRALKWDPFGSSFRDISRSDFRKAFRVIAAVSAAVGDSAGLMIEGHGRFEVPAARRIATELENYDVLWFEEPLIPGNLENYGRLRGQTSTPISMGERLFTRWEFREVFEKGCADFIQPDVSHAGGIWELRKIAALAEIWQTAFCPHNPSGPVANAATLQLAACVPNFLYLETMATDVPWRSKVASEQCRLVQGEMTIPDAPGLGIEIDEDALAAYPYQVHELRHYTGALTAIRPPDASATFGAEEKEVKTVPVYDFRGRTVLVTGATRNLGFTIAVEFARAGARVILHGPSREESREATRRLGEILSSADAHEASFDLGNPAEIETAFSDLSQRGLVPDILVNNAAHLGLGESGFLAQTPEFFRSVLEVNLFGAFRCSQLAAAAMKGKGAGAIIFISSLAGERVIWGRSAYNVSKAALDGLMRSMSVELASDGIRVNAIAPGYVWTPRWESISEEVEARRHRNIPATAPTQQEEIANAVLFLASDGAPTLVGARLVLDGGLDVQQVPRDVAV